MNENQLLESAAFVKRAQPTKPFYEYLKAEREAARTRLETAKGEQVYIEQGKAQFVTKLLQLIEEAENILANQ